jgi:hypothetical protein
VIVCGGDRRSQSVARGIAERRQARSAKPAGARQAAESTPEPHQPIRSAAFTNDPVLGKDQHRVDGEEVHGVVAFTFDDGPNPETTPP